MIHLPENIWNSQVIKKRLWNEANFESNNGAPAKAHYWIVAPTVDGSRDHHILKNFSVGIMDVEPHDMQMAFAQELRYRLQKDLSHDGLWLVGWTHPPASWEAIKVDGDNCWNRLVMVWLDEDADPHFTVETDIPFVEMIGRGGHYYLELAEEAHKTWAEAYGKKARRDDFGLRDDQQTKKALAALN